MEWIRVTLRIYRRVFGRAAELVGKNWLVAASVFLYAAVLNIGGLVAAPLGLIGGFLITLVEAACIGSFLYLVEMMVRTSRVTLEDVRRSFTAYLWDVVGIMFLWWVFSMIAAPALMQTPQGPVLMLCIQLAVLVFFNAVPELIYLGHYSSVQLLGESYAFIGANWPEWFPANLVAIGLVYAAGAVPVNGPTAYLQYALIALLVYFSMVMRGLLFIELQGSSRRGRAFRYRVEG